MTDREEGVVLCPDNIAVIGGGRWARVLTEVLCGVVPPTARISVHSIHNAGLMFDWVEERGYSERVSVSSEWPQFASKGSNAVIVANAARDHEKAVDWAVSAGVPVLVEKPIATTLAASKRLVDLANSRNVRFASAHVFLFARYLDNFSKLVADEGNVRSLRVLWMDPSNESRYGEQKQYDPGLPIFSDWLPHVLSIVGALTPNLPQRCENLEFFKGGAHLELKLTLGNIPCSVKLVRNGAIRQRIIEVITTEKTLHIDFSKEPGIIISGSSIIDGDPDWEADRRPVSRMLAAFLKGAAGGEFDNRLDAEIGLRASRVIDQTLRMYNSAQKSWLVSRLGGSQIKLDDDLHYALSEMLQAGGPLSPAALEQQIKLILHRFSGTEGKRWVSELLGASDTALLLRSIAM